MLPEMRSSCVTPGEPRRRSQSLDSNCLLFVTGVYREGRFYVEGEMAMATQKMEGEICVVRVEDWLTV